MSVEIVMERPDAADAVALIQEIVRNVASAYPQQSRHGRSPEELAMEAVAFFIIRVNGTAAGCGGIKLGGDGYGEIKRLYIRPQFRGQGLAKRMMEHLEAYARGHDVCILRLQTGIYQIEAMELYRQSGYLEIPPFSPYQEDPFNRFYEKRIG